MQYVLKERTLLTGIQRLRPLAYSKAHVILIGYAVDTPDSLDNVINKVGPYTPYLPDIC